MVRLEPGMIWVALYAVALLALFVRFEDPEQPRRRAVVPDPAEPLGLIALHHRLAYAVLLGAPIEAMVLGGQPAGRMVGAVALGLGVALYRWGAVALGDALSPFVHPVRGASVVQSGPYRVMRHPMYLGHVLIVVGAPLTLGARATLALTAAAVVVIGVRLVREDRVLREGLAGYREYAARTKRIVPRIL